MSRYKIYRIDHYDPKAISRRIRKISFIAIVIYALAFITNTIIYNKSKAGLSPSVFNLLGYLVLAALIIYISLIIKKLKSIGSIEFLRNKMIKRIEDTQTEYLYTDIKELKITKHIPSTSVLQSSSGYFSYILTITFINDNTESIVVADKESGIKKNISIIATLKTLQKICNLEIKMP